MASGRETWPTTWVARVLCLLSCKKRDNSTGNRWKSSAIAFTFLLQYFSKVSGHIAITVPVNKPNDVELEAYTNALFQLTALENPSRSELEAIELLPTDDDVRATLGDPAVPATAARSTENGFLPAALEVARHLAGHVSVCEVRPLESSLDDRPDSRFPVLPSAAKTTSSTPSLRSLRAPDLEAWNKTPARRCLRVRGSDS